MALKLLYQMDVLGSTENTETETPAQLLQKNRNFFRGLNKTEKGFIIKLMQKILENKEKIDQLIDQNLLGWKLERLMTVDRNLLRMGIAESSFNPQKAVIIDDIVRIAKKYGGEESYKIINALLDKVIT